MSTIQHEEYKNHEMDFSDFKAYSLGEMHLITKQKHSRW